MGAIAVGDFTARIKTASQGDLGHLEQTINQSVSTLELAVQEVTRMAWVMSEGDLTQVTRNDLEGEFDNIALALKCVSISVEGIVDDVRAIAEDMKQRGEAVGISTKHAIELNNLMKFLALMLKIQVVSKPNKCYKVKK